ncbi:MAG: hypothetical protein ACPL7E_05855 [bacterium]
MRIVELLISSLLLFLTACGGGGSITTSGGGGSITTSGYQVEVFNSIWNASTRTLSLFYSCIPPQNTTISSMQGEFRGPASGQFTPTFNPSTNIWIAEIVFPEQGGTYEISIYATDSSGNSTLIYQFKYDVLSGSGGAPGGGSSDTPPPPPFK